MKEFSGKFDAALRGRNRQRSTATMSNAPRSGWAEVSEDLDEWVGAVCAGTRAESNSALVARLIKEAKSALVQERTKVALVIADSAFEVVLVLNPSGLIAKASRMSSELLGWSELNIVGLPIDSLLSLRYLGIAASTDEMARAEGGEQVHSTRLHARDDGTTFQAEHTVLALVGPLGEVSGFSRTIRNVSDRVLHEARIEELNLSIALLV